MVDSMCTVLHSYLYCCRKQSKQEPNSSAGDTAAADGGRVEFKKAAVPQHLEAEEQDDVEGDPDANSETEWVQALIRLQVSGQNGTLPARVEKAQAVEQSPPVINGGRSSLGHPGHFRTHDAVGRDSLANGSLDEPEDEGFVDAKKKSTGRRKEIPKSVPAASSGGLQTGGPQQSNGRAAAVHCLLPPSQDAPNSPPGAPRRPKPSAPQQVFLGGSEGSFFPGSLVQESSNFGSRTEQTLPSGRDEGDGGPYAYQALQQASRVPAWAETDLWALSSDVEELICCPIPQVPAPFKRTS
jgi:hypothetical protein